MIGIMVVGHGHFATGITSAVELIMGKQENYIAVDFPDGDTKTELENHIREGIFQLGSMEHILVFCDIVSGSPFNTIMVETMEDSRFKIFYGTTLGILVETLFERNMNNNWENLISEIVDKGRAQVGVYETQENAAQEEDEGWD